MISESPSITFITPNQTLIKSNSIHQHEINLTCRATGSPTPILSWTYNGQILLSTSRIHYAQTQPEINNKSLYIDEHGNGITFNAHYGNNISTIKSKTMTDNVNRQYEGIAKYIRINDDDDANADIDGDHRVIGNDDSITAIELILLLSKMKKLSAGRFTCVALNAIGTDEKYTYVNVLGELAKKKKQP